jgi:hypothetical protein
LRPKASLSSNSGTTSNISSQPIMLARHIMSFALTSRIVETVARETATSSI